MLRSIKSQQRLTRMLAFIISADGETISGLDANKITVTDTGTGVKTVELGSNGFADDDYIVIVTPATDESIARVSITDKNTFVITTDDATDGTSAKDAIVHVLVIGSDAVERT